MDLEMLLWTLGGLALAGIALGMYAHLRIDRVEAEVLAADREGEAGQ